MKKLLRTSTIPSTLAVFCRKQLIRLSEIYDLTVVSSSGADIDKLKSDGLKVETVEMKRHISPLSDLVSLWKMYRLLVRVRPDAVHSITPKAGLVTMLAAKIAGVPVRIHTFTGLVWPTAKGLKRQLLIASDRLLCKCATHIIPEGRGVMNDLYSGKITSKPLKVLGHGNIRGIDSSYFNDKIKFPDPEILEPDTFNFIFVGRIVGDKGISELVSAFQRVSQHRSDLRLWLIGRRESDLDRLPEKTASSIDRDDRIVEVGEVSDVRPYLAAAQCLILPSYREGFPNSVIEAGAMGLPVIVTDINGSNEIVVDRVNGLIVRPRDVDSLCAAMTEIVSDGKLMADLSREARSMVVSRFDEEKVYNALDDFYHDII